MTLEENKAPPSPQAEKSSLTDQDIYDELTAIFRKLFRNPTLVLTADTSPAQIGYWNSFAQVNIILAIEDRFDFEIGTQEMRNLNTAADFARLIRAQSPVCR